ncbi:glycoside hydrolase family 16 protein [Calycina marina]|uniref:Glycoside hydrolase family 16 protein n=1 Tax=Calycina marina TaxID=1763456 RepID=A0A9P7Z9F9_9HELO|nr:glycoside hydrolase family 16 protein [Calycina marina]
MFTKALSATVLLSTLSLVQAQTFSSCNPTENSSCPDDAALGGVQTTDFSQASSDWTELTGTTLTYSDDGALFTIEALLEAPTIQSNKYIMFGAVSAVMKASDGDSIVSSFILESDDLDEIDWEWLGNEPTQVQTNFFGKGDTSTYDRGVTYTISNDTVTTFVNYTIEWTAEKIVWSLGVPDSGTSTVMRTLLATDSLTINQTRYPQTPMIVKMGNWIACPDSSDTDLAGTCEWAGAAWNGDDVPYTMTVKSVTISDYGCGNSSNPYKYTDMTGDASSITPSGYCAGPLKNTDTSASSDSSVSAATSTGTVKDGVFVESSTSLGSATATGSDAAATGDSSTSVSLSTTTTSGSSVTTSASAQVSDSAAGKPKHKMGALDAGVMVLGLGIGYLVM